MADALNPEGGTALQIALKSSSALKTDVVETFSKIASGMQLNASQQSSEQGEQQKGQDGKKPGAKESAFILEVQKSFLGICQHMKELEDSIGTLNPPPSGNMSLGNAQLIAQDSGADKFDLYAEMTRSYAWIDKLHEYSNLAHLTSGQHSTKKTNTMAGLGSKKRRPASHNVPINIVDTTIIAIERQFKDMNIVITRPYGSNAILHVTLGRVLIAVVVLKGLMIESVVVRGIDETFLSDDGKPDPWTPSRHAVFRKVTENANAAMLNYYSPVMPELSLRSFLTWFHSFLRIFSDVCKKCGMHLHNHLPPTWRDFRALEPYHEACKP